MMSFHWLIARGAMRCISCGAELRLMQSELDNITMVPSHKHCAFLCENCDRPPVNPDRVLPPTEPEPARSALAASLRPDEPVSVAITRRDLHWSHRRATSTSVRSSLDAQSKWSEAQRVGLNQQEALLTACPEGPSRAASFRFITTPATPRTSQRTPSRVYASCGTETARACARCVIGLDGRWSRPTLQRG